MKITQKYLQELINEEVAALIKEYGMDFSKPAISKGTIKAPAEGEGTGRWTEGQISTVLSQLAAIEEKLNDLVDGQLMSR